MTHDELREKVATICGGNYVAADAVIDIVLEEAAQKIESFYGHGMTKEHAAAIRGMKGEDSE